MPRRAHSPPSPAALAGRLIALPRPPPHHTQAHVDRAILESSDEGFCKVLVRKGTPEILGATIVVTLPLLAPRACPPPARGDAAPPRASRPMTAVAGPPAKDPPLFVPALLSSVVCARRVLTWLGVLRLGAAGRRRTPATSSLSSR